MRLPTLAAALLLALPAIGQEQLTFTTEDAEQMTACLEGLSDAPGSDDGTEQSSSMADCAGAAANACMETEQGGYSTAGMVECTARETDWWDSQLNATYATLEETLGAELFASLQEAQRAWVDYRDKACAFEYDLWADGTIRSVIQTSCMLHQTAARAEMLDTYAKGGQ